MAEFLKALSKNVKLAPNESNAFKKLNEPQVSLQKNTSKKTNKIQTPESIRKQENIRVFGSDIPNLIASFGALITEQQLPLPFETILKEANFLEPTAIQKQAIPLLLEGRDVMACAPTGSGKTLAFILPILSILKKHDRHTGFRALIIVPTRELALQIEREFFKFLVQFKVCFLSKDKIAGFKSAPKHSFDILISTPLSLVHCVEEKIIDLSHLSILILDEADRLLEENFLEQTDAILAACPKKIVKGLFTATLNSTVELLAHSFMFDPVRVYVGPQNAATATIQQEILFVGQEEGKLMAIRNIFLKGVTPPILIFMDSIERANTLYMQLVQQKIPADVIHSDKSAAERAVIIKNFRIGKLWVLITTELLARGVDFKGVRCVINYDFPRTTASYIHRIGRTGRAGRPGRAITLYTLEDIDYLKSIANVMKASGCQVPEHLLQLKKVKNSDKRKRKQVEVKKKGKVVPTVQDNAASAEDDEDIEDFSDIE